MLDMVYPTQVKSEEIVTQSTFKYLEGAPAISQCFAAKPLSLGVCDPGQSHPELVLSSAAYQPTKSRCQ